MIQKKFVHAVDCNERKIFTKICESLRLSSSLTKIEVISVLQIPYKFNISV